MLVRTFAILAAFFVAIASPLGVVPVYASEGGERDIGNTSPRVVKKKRPARPPSATRKPRTATPRTTTRRPTVRKKTVSRTPSRRTTRRAVVRKRSPTRRATVRRAAVRAAPVRRAESGLPPAGEDRFLPDQVIVRYRNNAPARRLNALVARLGLRHEQARTFALAGITTHLYTIANGASVRETITALEASSDVLATQPNYIYVTQQAAGSAAGAQYALAKLNLPDTQPAGGSTVKIAVIDTLIDTSHPEFSNSTFATHDLVEEADAETDDHGTSMAGVLAAGGTLSGLAPRATIVAIRAFRRTDDGKTLSDSWTLGRALDLAHQQGARVFNLSFSGPADPLIRDSLQGAERRGIVAVAAAGNGGPDSAPLYPAGYETTLAVTATASDDSIYEKANRGAYVSLAAPGVQILTSTANGGYGMKTGTSIATAHASGVVALALESQPDAKPQRVREVIRQTAVDLGAPGPDPVYGSGLVNARALLGTLQEK